MVAKMKKDVFMRSLKYCVYIIILINTIGCSSNRSIENIFPTIIYTQEPLVTLTLKPTGIPPAQAITRLPPLTDNFGHLFLLGDDWNESYINILPIKLHEYLVSPLKRVATYSDIFYDIAPDGCNYYFFRENQIFSKAMVSKEETKIMNDDDFLELVSRDKYFKELHEAEKDDYAYFGVYLWAQAYIKGFSADGRFVLIPGNNQQWLFEIKTKKFYLLNNIKLLTWPNKPSQYFLGIETNQSAVLIDVENFQTEKISDDRYISWDNSGKNILFQNKQGQYFEYSIENKTYQNFYGDFLDYGEKAIPLEIQGNLTRAVENLISSQTNEVRIQYITYINNTKNVLFVLTSNNKESQNTINSKTYIFLINSTNNEILTSSTLESQFNFRKAIYVPNFDVDNCN
jgi:hypothetical protein